MEDHSVRRSEGLGVPEVIQVFQKITWEKHTNLFYHLIMMKKIKLFNLTSRSALGEQQSQTKSGTYIMHKNKNIGINRCL